jgi:hypothetical protein
VFFRAFRGQLFFSNKFQGSKLLWQYNGFPVT